MSELSSNERFPRTVEARLKEWELGQDKESIHLTGGGEIDYITISREIGSGGEEVARHLSEIMKWDVYDKDILNFMAENMQVHKDVLESVDEKTRGWIQDSLSIFFSNKKSGRVDQSGYYKHLMEALLVIGRHKRAIILGRAAGHILPRDRGLSVRITAPFELRCRRYAKKQDMSLEQAISEVKKRDKDQKRFVKDFLWKDAFDISYFDIVFNTEKLSPPAVAKLIWRAFDQRIQHEKKEKTPQDQQSETTS